MAQQHINFSQPNDGLGDTLRESQIKAESNFNELYSNKVDKVLGQGLSDTNFTQLEKDKLEGLQEGGQLQTDWDQGDNTQKDYLKNKPENVSEFFNDSEYVVDVPTAGIFARSSGEWIDLATANPFNTFKPIQKGFGNVLQTPEPGDIYCGWSNDGTIRYTEALYISGPLNDSDNFTPLVQTEI
jgi:hypothetical protein